MHTTGNSKYTSQYKNCIHLCSSPDTQPIVNVQYVQGHEQSSHPYYLLAGVSDTTIQRCARTTCAGSNARITKIILNEIIVLRSSRDCIISSSAPILALPTAYQFYRHACMYDLSGSDIAFLTGGTYRKGRCVRSECFRDGCAA